MGSSMDTAPPHVRAAAASNAASMAAARAELAAMGALTDMHAQYSVEEVLAELGANVVEEKPDPYAPPWSAPPSWSFFRLKQYQQDIRGIDPRRAAILGAALRLLAVDSREAFGVFDTWVDEYGGEERRLDLHGWGTLGYMLDEQKIVLHFVNWVD